MKYSFSQISKYGQCPKSWQYHYQEKLKPLGTTSSLLFGSAMDEALNALLANPEADYEVIFKEAMQNITINGKKIPFTEGLLRIEFLSSDYEEYFGHGILDTTESYASLKERESEPEFNIKDRIQLNYHIWNSLLQKGLFLIKAYKEELLPKISEVVAIQKQIGMNSEDGESTIVGYIDAIVKLKGSDELVILDNKTASAEYTTDKLTFSQQLALYSYLTGINTVAYAVLIKKIKFNEKKNCLKCGYDVTTSHKSCPNTVQDGTRCGGELSKLTTPVAKTQLISTTMPDSIKEVVVNNISDVIQAINTGVFPQNFNTCQNLFGKPCPYTKMCWSGSEDGLERG